MTRRRHASGGRRVEPRAAGAFACALAVLLGGCARNEPNPRPVTSAARPALSAAGPASRAPAPAGTAPARRDAEPVASIVREQLRDGGLPGLRLGELTDAGPAGPATAFAEGVVLVTKDDRLLVARLARQTPVLKAKLEPIAEAQASFAPLTRAPSVAGAFAYWISKGRLVRRATTSEAELEVLASDARASTRTSAVELEGKVAVAYLGKADTEGTSRARLWIEGGKPVDLTPDGAGASSVALVRHAGGLLAAAIDGRTAMTPLHARRLKWKGSSLELEPDVVTWVGGPAQTWTEVMLGSSRGRAYAHLAIERDATHFGLASVELGDEPRMDSPVSFFDYLNGLDLAPAATTELCGRGYVSFVRPVSHVPRAPQELVLVEAGQNHATVLATGHRFVSVSLAAAGGGGLVVYVADGRTWARGLGCE
jgi:hypothetical protein